jgi:hypothetical protein
MARKLDDLFANQMVKKQDGGQKWYQSFKKPDKFVLFSDH